MNTYKVETSGANQSKGQYMFQARTRGDAVMYAQKLHAQQHGLDRTDEALVRVEFRDEAAS